MSNYHSIISERQYSAWPVVDWRGHQSGCIMHGMWPNELLILLVIGWLVTWWSKKDWLSCLRALSTARSERRSPQVSRLMTGLSLKLSLPLASSPCPSYCNYKMHIKVMFGPCLATKMAICLFTSWRLMEMDRRLRDLFTELTSLSGSAMRRPDSVYASWQSVQLN